MTKSRRRQWRSSGILLLFAFCLFGLAVACPAAGTNAAPAVRAAQKIFHWRPFLAPFHAVVLHFPIGFLTVAFILEIYQLFRPSIEVRRATALIIWCSLVTGIVSAIFGIMRAGSGDYDPNTLIQHRAFGLAIPIFTVLTLVTLKFLISHYGSLRALLFYRGALSLTLLMLVIAGHYGGNLTHGSRYLVQNAPEFVREWLDEDPEAETLAPGALNQKQKFYLEKVQPIFSAKCYSCHGSEKQKGGYRLDKPEIALKGGKSGIAAIVPGDPLESHLVRLILLPRQNDDAMPPDGKQPLTVEEIATVLDWIRNGANFPAESTNSIPSLTKKE
jgi:uncharacterized membrane protein